MDNSLSTEKKIGDKIGGKIKYIRTKLDLSQAELGDAIGIHQVSIGRYENGERIPSIETLDKIAALISKKADWFFETDMEKDIKEVLLENRTLLQEILHQLQILNSKVR